MTHNPAPSSDSSKVDLTHDLNTLRQHYELQRMPDAKTRIQWLKSAKRMLLENQQAICDALNEHLQPKGVAVIVDARHMCMEMRGVQKIRSTTVTSALRGLFKSNKKTKDEFLSIVSNSLHK